MTSDPLSEFYDKYPILSGQKFDLLISHAFGNFGAILAHKLQIPKWIYLLPGIYILEPTAVNLELPVNPSHVVTSFGRWGSNMGFGQRLLNSFYLSIGCRSLAKFFSLFFEDEDSFWLEVATSLHSKA